MWVWNNLEDLEVYDVNAWRACVRVCCGGWSAQQACFFASEPSGRAKDAMMRTNTNRQAMMMEEEETVVVIDLTCACGSLLG